MDYFLTCFFLKKNIRVRNIFFSIPTRNPTYVTSIYYKFNLINLIYFVKIKNIKKINLLLIYICSKNWKIVCYRVYENLGLLLKF